MALPAPSVKLSTTNATEIYAVPAGKRALVTVNLAAILACKPKVAFTAGGAPVDADFIHPGKPMAALDCLERTGLVLPAGYKVFAQSDVANACCVQVWGLEEAV